MLLTVGPAEALNAGRDVVRGHQKVGAFGKLGGVAGGARGAGRFGEGKLHLNVFTVQDKIGQLNILEAVSVRRRRTEGV